MKITLAIASSFALALTLVSAASVKVGHRGYDDHKGQCDNGQLLENTTIADYGGYPIGFAATYCPEDCKEKEKKKEKKKEEKKYARGDDHKYKSDKGACSLSCVDVIDYPIYPGDCGPVIEYLESLDSATFTIPAQTYYEWYYGSCAIIFWNFDCCEYDVCYADFGYDAYVSAETCLGTTNGAVCAGSGNPGDDYAIIVA